MSRSTLQIAAIVLLLGVVAYAASLGDNQEASTPQGRSEVLFWHFWGGADRATVEEIVRRFNESQDEHYVRAIAMPGNNLDLKFFLAVAGGDPPDLLNIDDPVIADWGARGAILPLDAFAPAEEVRQAEKWLFPAARRLATYDGRLYALPNGLDIRALYYHQTLLDQYGLKPPETLADLDQIETTIAPPGQKSYQRHGYLPDSRRLWPWGYVFGGQFYNKETHQVTADDPQIVASLEWMVGFRQRYGPAEIAAFRSGDQSLPGKAFPLLAGRYAVMMDGQWRVRDIRAFQAAQRERGEPITQFGVCPLPPPPGGKTRAGWVNGNNFVVPRGAKNAAGAWAFMKFWSGLGHETEAAQTCVAGGWIPVSGQVVQQPQFQAFLKEEPMFAQFVDLAGSENQYPIPVVPAGAFFDSEIKNVAERAMLRTEEPDCAAMLKEATRVIQRQIDAARESVE
ncbi:ABC transporter substrate-binding protein [Blastopirellula sp. JC732]|uniref:ABC transporter substrate-binding protein n=1 Tax=Blastopirellula sediminis TaxID=2894196 RepID=A0A9X1MNW9_9BACT|nr:ABC transporter substrate-binding protein [Blastopirellula sediminis]MCC9607067.1 ABC transporter substrate-binding protein [Blastopirellula sediminis]MCC9629640.1 ABC transporter substrate-binding protein [Blastopirellula sediminis]